VALAGTGKVSVRVRAAKASPSPHESAQESSESRRFASTGGGGDVRVPATSDLITANFLC